MTRFIPTSRGARIVAVGVCVLMGLASARFLDPSSVPTPQLAGDARSGLILAVGPHRFTDARLIGFEYRPPSPSPADATARATLSPDLRIALARMQERYDEDDSTANEAGWAAARLVVGDVEGALRLFGRAVGREQHDAGVWNDAAAGYLTAAAQLHFDELWIRALDAAERALDLRPLMPEAVFNRALALEGLALTREARQAWQQYLDLDPQSPWSADAGRRRDALDAVAQRTWTAYRQGLEGRPAATGSQDVAGARQFRQELRAWIEQELIPGWATAFLARESVTAAAALRRAAAVAELLERAGGDSAPIAAIRQAAKLSSSDPARARALATAHLAFPNVVRASDDGEYGKAADEFGQVYRTFRAAGSPYADYEAIYTAIAQYMGRHLQRARSTLARLESPSRPPSTVHGLRDWMKGLIALNENRLHEARAHYREALRHFEALGETESMARISALLAESYAALGDTRQAWQFQRQALAGAIAIRVPRRKHLILQLGGLLCLRDGAPYGALAFQNAVIQSAKDSQAHGPSLVEGYLHRARTYLRLNKSAEAGADLDRARALVKDLQPAALRPAHEAEIDAATAEVLSQRQPDEAIAAASRALGYFAGRSGEFRSAGLLVGRGRNYLMLGRIDQAEADLAAAIQRFEALRHHVVDRQDRIRLFHDGWDAYARMAGLLVEHRDEPGRALDYAEQGRARTLLESMVGRDAKPASAAAIARTLPSSTAVLFYVTRPDRVWVWALTGGSVSFFERRVEAGSLESRIARVQRLVSDSRRNKGERQRRMLTGTLASLHHDLIAPAAAAVRGAASLVIVPDGPLHGLPFSALLDPSSGKYLVQEHAVAYSPSLSALRSTGAPFNRGDRVLVLGDPDIGPGDQQPKRLPFARREAQEIAAIHPGAQLLLGAGASRQAFLRELKGADLVHYAGHAVVDAEDLDRSKLLLASTDGAEGTLYVDELRTVRLDRRPIVVLAACSTARGRVERSEGVLSIARPFLASGAREVVATLWDVSDREGADLFVRFHGALVRGLPAARALAEVQRVFIEAADPFRRDPAAWAWAVAIGFAMTPTNLQEPLKE